MDDIWKPMTALGHDAPRTVSIGPFVIAERVDRALASLAARRGCAADVARVAAGLGLPLPGPGRAEAGAVWGAFWLSDAQWMVEAPIARHEDIVAHLKPAFGDAASITEQTDAWVRFDISAPDLPKLMERLSNFDLALATVGAATRTVLDHLGCYLIKVGECEITLYGPRSSADSLHHALVVAARSVL